jgi:hypothetical protein
MLVRIDGLPASPEALGWPVMNWGQFHWDAPLGEYELTIPRKVFVDGMTAEYAQLVAELRHDDAFDPDGTPYLREIGYPPLEVALDHPRQARELIRVFLNPEIFETFLPITAPPRFLMNSIDSVSVTTDAVVLRGRGYHLPQVDGGPGGH